LAFFFIVFPATLAYTTLVNQELTTTNAAHLMGGKPTLAESSFLGQAWWLMPVIPTTWKADIGKSPFEVSPEKNKLLRLHLNEQARRGGTCLKF
jgi:hypothetical protein